MYQVVKSRRYSRKKYADDNNTLEDAKAIPRRKVHFDPRSSESLVTDGKISSRYPRGNSSRERQKKKNRLVEPLTSDTLDRGSGMPGVIRQRPPCAFLFATLMRELRSICIT